MLDLVKTNIAEAAEVGAEFELLIPKSNAATGAFVKVRGEESEVVRKHGRKVFNDSQARAAMARKRGKEDQPMTLEEAEEQLTEAALIRVISWRGIAENGKEVEFNRENALRIFKQHPWIRDQILEESKTIVYFQ